MKFWTMIFTAAAMALSVQFANAEEDTGPCGADPEKRTWYFERYVPPYESGTFAITIDFRSAEEIAKYCGKGALACTDSGTDKAPVVHAARPADFNDRNQLCIIGHETLHALGATHEPIARLTQKRLPVKKLED